MLVHRLPVRLTRGSHGTKTAYVLGMVITANGPRAAAIMRTVTHAPKPVVLDPYSAARPRDWRHVSFGDSRKGRPRRLAANLSAAGRDRA